MDDIKTLPRIKRNRNLIEMVRIFNQNFGIKCSTDKCAIDTMNKGKEETI